MSEPVKPDKHRKLELVRVAVLRDGAFGVLLIDGAPFCVTLERTYSTDGGPVVKIPAGDYLCSRTVYYTGGYKTWEILGVHGHSRLLFHVGNTARDSDGCVLLGASFGRMQGVPAILTSRLTFNAFTEELADAESVGLTVR